MFAICITSLFYDNNLTNKVPQSIIQYFERLSRFFMEKTKEIEDMRICAYPQYYYEHISPYRSIY